MDDDIKALITAIDQRDIVKVESILDSDPNHVRAQWMSDGDTPLHFAVRRDFDRQDAVDLSIVELLLAKGADSNVRKDDGKTPLHIAVWYNYAIVVRLLVEKGADVNAKDNGKDTALHVASGYLSEGAEIANILVTNGADVNAVNGIGWTPLRYAMHHNHYAVRNVLMDYGAKM